MSSLIHKLKTVHPDISFVEAEQFSWSPTTRTILFNRGIPHAPLLLLHELSHASLDHREYRRDIELIAMETAAWEKAKEHAQEYKVRVYEAVIQDHLDTYREWLHARSSCPNCSANGYQSETLQYECPACAHTWKVNEARLCALRRYSVKTK
jgi:Uncharacterized Zn-ribbon-containing protein involved in phosphonate metabolism